MGSYSCLEDLQPLLYLYHDGMPSDESMRGGDATATAGWLVTNPVGILWEVEQSKSAEQPPGSGDNGGSGGGVTCEGGGCDIVFTSFAG